jgi:hypothetical protein
VAYQRRTKVRDALVDPPPSPGPVREPTATAVAAKPN